MPDTSPIWWHVYPLGATGAPVQERQEDDDAHRLLRLVPWLDHVVELGCDGLLLGPVFASTSHGYDTLDHHTLDPRLGDDADWDRFVQQAKDRGLQIMLDGVFNHVGIDHPLVQGGVVDRVDRHRARVGHGEGRAVLGSLIFVASFHHSVLDNTMLLLALHDPHLHVDSKICPVSVFRRQSVRLQKDF